jgi:GLPGLI family protein
MQLCCYLCKLSLKKSYLKFATSSYIAISLILVLFNSCKKRSESIKDDEGIIFYHINYLDETIGGYSSGILPQKMESRFKKGKVKNTIEGALGFFSLINISDINEMTNTTCLKFIDKKYVYKGKKKESPCCFAGFKDMDIEFTDNTKQIINYTCQEAVITFPETDRQSFSVYYTTDIKCNKPNATGPFREIPGILMEFHAILGPTEVIMIAEKFQSESIPDKEFIIPKHYKEINKKELENILNALLE